MFVSVLRTHIIIVVIHVAKAYRAISLIILVVLRRVGTPEEVLYARARF
jgi:hypothetical protein